MIRLEIYQAIMFTIAVSMTIYFFSTYFWWIVNETLSEKEK